MPSVQIPNEQVFGPTGVASYASLATLAKEQARITVGTIVACEEPFMLFQAVETQPAQYSALSTASAVYGGGVTYWVPLGGLATGQQTPFTARAASLAIAAYDGSGTGTLTGHANGALAAQDGVSLVVGDQLLLQAGVTNVSAVDSGPFVVVSLGSATTKYVLTRPAWFLTGNLVNPDTEVAIGPEGTVYANSTFKATAVASTVIDTTDPGFYVERLGFAITLVAGVDALTAGQGGVGSGHFPAGVYNASTSSIQASVLAFGGTQASTVSFGVPAAPIAGYIGTSAATLLAFQAGMTAATGDTSTLVIELVNF